MVQDLAEIRSAFDWDYIIEKGRVTAERLAEGIYFESSLLEDKIRQQEENRYSYFRS